MTKIVLNLVYPFLVCSISKNKKKILKHCMLNIQRPWNFLLVKFKKNKIHLLLRPRSYDDKK